MKICYLSDAQSPHTQKWAKFFAEQGHKIYVISFHPAEIKGIETIYVRDRFHIRGKKRYLFYLGKIKKIVHQIKPNILHAHHATSYGLAGAYSQYHPYVISVWGSDIMDFPKKSSIHKIILRYNLTKADVITATSKILATATQKIVPNRYIYTIPFGVEDDFLLPQKSRKIYEIGIIKTLSPKYGIKYLIKTIPIVKSHFPHLRVLIGGEGEQENELKKLASDLKVNNNIDFVGRIPHPLVPQYLAKIKIFVVPSVMESESFGVAAIEASAMGIPVIASRIGGLPEVVTDEKTGFLIPPKNHKILASKIIYLLQNPSLQTELGKHGREFVMQNYLLAKCGIKMSAIYDRLLAEV